MHNIREPTACILRSLWKQVYQQTSLICSFIWCSQVNKSRVSLLELRKIWFRLENKRRMHGLGSFLQGERLWTFMNSLLSHQKSLQKYPKNRKKSSRPAVTNVVDFGVTPLSSLKGMRSRNVTRSHGVVELNRSIISLIEVLTTTRAYSSKSFILCLYMKTIRA